MDRLRRLEPEQHRRLDAIQQRRQRLSAILSFVGHYSYDNLNRLTQAIDQNPAYTVTNWSRQFNYDQWGNSWVSNVSGPLAGNTPTTNVYNSATNRDGRWNYDAAGNMTKVNGNTAVYNAENQLASLSTSTGASETIAYDALGYRVQKTVSGSSPVTYVYDAFGLAAEYVNGSWVKDYIADGSGNLVATENAAGGPCTTCYYTSDHLGSVRAVTDSNANVVGRHDYLPFGEEIQANTAGRDSHFGSITDVTERFTGQIRDQESGVDYFNARYFTAPLGRFNSPDPGNAGASLLSSQSWNGYAYVLGNPLASVDPTGMTTACTGNAAMHDPFCQIGPWAQYPGMNAINQVDPFGIQGSVSDYQLTLSTAGSQQSATMYPTLSSCA